MYPNHAFSTPFSVKDILSWTEQQQAAAHYGMDFNSFNMNSGYYGYETPRLGEQMNSMSQMSPMMNSLGGNSCLYSSNNTSPSLQPTYTNLTCSPSVSSMTSMSSGMQLPLQTDGMSPKHDSYDTHGAPTPGSEQEDMHNAGQALAQASQPPPPSLEPGSVLPQSNQPNLPQPMIKHEAGEDLMDKSEFFFIFIFFTYFLQNFYTILECHNIRSFATNFLSFSKNISKKKHCYIYI